MGNQPHKQKNIASKVFNHVFQSDPRLAEEVLFVPELFSGQIDSEIKEVQKLRNSLPSRPVEVEIIDGINERFAFRANAEKSSHSPSKKQKQMHLEIYELQNLSRFFDVLKKLQLFYYIGRELDKLVQTQNIGKKITVRKKTNPQYKSSLDKNLFARGYLLYYVILLKRNLTSREEESKKLVRDFHNNIGKMLCKMIEYDQLAENKLLQLFFNMVKIDKKPGKVYLEKGLLEIREEFWPLYLEKQHSLGLDPLQYDRIRQVSRCYLDQLYLRSIKEAQDPDIIVQPNEGLGIVRNFPVLRVKDKNR